MVEGEEDHVAGEEAEEAGLEVHHVEFLHHPLVLVGHGEDHGEVHGEDRGAEVHVHQDHLLAVDRHQHQQRNKHKHQFHPQQPQEEEDHVKVGFVKEVQGVVKVGGGDIEDTEEEEVITGVVVDTMVLVDTGGTG